MAKTLTKFTVGSNPSYPIYEIRTGTRCFFCVEQRTASGDPIPLEECQPFASIATLKKYAYAGRIDGVKVVKAEYQKKNTPQAQGQNTKASTRNSDSEPQRRAPRTPPPSSDGTWVYESKKTDFGGRGEDIIMVPSPVGGSNQPHYWILPGTPIVRTEAGFPVYGRTDGHDNRPIDCWTPPLTHYPTSVADAPLDPFFRRDYLEPQAKARNMSPDAFVLFLGRKYHSRVYPWKPQPLAPDDDPAALWTFLVEEAKRPELKRRTFSLFVYLLVDMEVEKWWHTGVKPVPEPAAVAETLAQQAAEDFTS